MKIESLEDLYLDQLRDLHDAEKQLVKALPDMAKASTSPQLRLAFESHLRETEGHAQRLDRIFTRLNEKSGGQSCDAMKGLVKEGEKMVSHVGASPLRDAGLIGAANRVEHYEMAAYGTARTFAELLGYNDDVRLLEQTLREEKDADQKLTQIAEQMVNDNALRVGVLQH